MKNSSLGAEPPSKFDGKKEVKKKNGNLPRLIVLLKNEKSKNKHVNSAKNLEEKTKTESKKYSFNINYLKNEENFIEENSTPTNEVLEFTSSNINLNQDVLNFYFRQEKTDFITPNETFSEVYEMSSNYSFIQETRGEEKKESSYVPKEQETKEISYAIYDFDEEA